ncbi:MAG: NmrA family NAD(P)-binding protein [Cytophagales bacterium]|nr:NmrA family NAD(P)-binding protein [Armatimonadota bacterium]
MFFVSGITGKVGGATARQLLREGHAVRALARDLRKAAAWQQQGVEVRQGDFNDAAAVAEALEGVAGAFLMIPPVMVPAPGFPEAKAVIASFEKALALAPPPRLVLLSSVGSQQSSGLGNITTTHLMEEALGDLPFPTAFVRAGGFLENYAGGLGAAAATGVFDSLLQPTDRTFPMVATADIGQEIARLLIGGWSGKKIVELGSPVSPNDLARAMSEVLGRPIQARAVPREQWAAALQAMGLPPGHTGLYEEMQDGFNSGWIAFGVPGSEPVAGTVTPAQVFAQAQKA